MVDLMIGDELRMKRVTARIPGHMVCERAGVSRGRLSEIERGHLNPPAGELQRLKTAIEDLIRAKRELTQFAAKCGWPAAAL